MYISSIFKLIGLCLVSAGLVKMFFARSTTKVQVNVYLIVATLYDALRTCRIDPLLTHSVQLSDDTRSSPCLLEFSVELPL